MAQNTILFDGSSKVILKDTVLGGWREQVTLYGPDGNALLPAAAVLSDTMANPTTILVGSALAAWDGTQWVRLKPDANRQLVMVERAGDGTAFADNNINDDAVVNRYGRDVRAFQFGETGAGTWERVRNNMPVTVFASAARTVTANSADQTNPNFTRAIFYLSISAASGTTPTLDVKIQVKDPVSLNYRDLDGVAFTQKVGVGDDTLTINPGILEKVATTDVDKRFSRVLPRQWRAVATIGGTTPSFTFSLGVTHLRG